MSSDSDDVVEFVYDTTKRSRWQNKRIATQEADEEMAEYYGKRTLSQPTSVPIDQPNSELNSCMNCPIESVWKII